ncbi:hypothetical protein V6N12_025612 [Hibiscus sabdariffa]|uniref:Uncharacterized protein n=1 Tax=Hibiscus sabdariffa TaxID=183260 RepID=A0ABR2CJ08_9ROSI
MASRADVLRRQKKDRLPRLPDPPPIVGGRVGTRRAEEARVVSPFRTVKGVVNNEKLSVLSTCAIGWVKKAVSIKVLAHKMVDAGLDGFELMWVAGSMVLLAFLVVDARGGFLSSPAVWSDWFERLEEWSTLVMYELRRAGISIGELLGRIDEVVEILVQDKVYRIVVQEVELVPVLAVEKWDVVTGSEIGAPSQQGASVVVDVK